MKTEESKKWIAYYDELRERYNMSIAIPALLEEYALQFSSRPPVTQQMIEGLTKLRNSLYDNVPTGMVESFELLKVIKLHLREFDKLIDYFNACLSLGASKYSITVEQIKEIQQDVMSQHFKIDDDYDFTNTENAIENAILKTISLGASEAQTEAIEFAQQIAEKGYRPITKRLYAHFTENVCDSEYFKASELYKLFKSQPAS